MNFENAVDLQYRIFRDVFQYIEVAEPHTLGASTAGPFLTSQLSNDAAEHNASVRTPFHTLAIGVEVSPYSAGQTRANQTFGIIIYCQDRKILHSSWVDNIKYQARGEARAVYVGPTRQLSSWEQSRQRPLRIGSSVGHSRTTAGTIGCFVELPTGERAILSNNHVLAHINQANLGDVILQPGRTDGGHDPMHRIATLHSFVPISFAANARNLIDAALATLLPNIKSESTIYDATSTIGTCGSVVAGSFDLDESVMKVGRTTGFTRGRIQAINVNNVMVAMSSSGAQSIARFDGQIVIEGVHDAAFSKPGDSGALVMNSACEAIGLVFAGTKTGGSNGLGLTYANPIGTVLQHLPCRLSN